MIAALRRHPLPIALAAVVFVLLSPFQAQAAWQSASSVSTSVGTATLAPVPSASAVAGLNNCGLGTQGTVTVSWTITPAAFATGYQITPVRNGTPQTPITVSGRSTLTAQVPVDRALLGTLPYTFMVRAGFANWTSTAVTTNSASCGLLIGGL
ncbi:hypothetical protein [Kineosporia succinea]|uniref:Fibronectin type-III domain-containing protein n=1 Tax=Kineosporia succinea TaxID=84632 RepID=A0ABT9P2Q0_9ACTN|nr:hypothetical protein [Kineosporia succinea]MDP9826954.1 hypothetical protein [Kineosporia succinea]